MAELGFVGVLLSAGDTGRRFITDTLGPILEYDVRPRIGSGDHP